MYEFAAKWCFVRSATAKYMYILFDMVPQRSLEENWSQGS